MRVWSLLPVSLLLACATTPKPHRPMPPPPAFRSSIDAVLAFRGELGLTDDQVLRLQAIDDKLEQDDAAIRAELRPAGKSGDIGSGPASSSPVGTGSPGAPGGAGMGGMGGRGMGGRGGMGRGPAMGAPPRDPDQAARFEAARAKLDDNDTAAFFAAQEVLTEAQKPRAQEIASKYRSDLMDYREAMKQRRE